MELDKKINQIQFPGTHDTCAYQLTEGYNDNKWLKILQILRKLKCIDRIAREWTLTQELNITQQLELGIRFFDLRVMYDVGKEAFYFAHTLNCILADEWLNEVKSYLDAHPEVFCIFSIRPDHANRHTFDYQQALEFSNKMKEILGSRFVIKRTPNPSQSGKFLFPTLGECLSNREQILFIYNTDAPHEYGSEWIWSFYLYADNVWYQTLSDEVLYQQIKEFIQKPEDPLDNRIKYISLTMSTSTSYLVINILKNFFVPKNKRKNIYSMSYHIQKFLERYKEEGVVLDSMCGWLADFPDDSFVYNVNH